MLEWVQLTKLNLIKPYFWVSLVICLVPSFKQFRKVWDTILCVRKVGEFLWPWSYLVRSMCTFVKCNYTIRRKCFPPKYSQPLHSTAHIFLTYTCQVARHYICWIRNQVAWARRRDIQRWNIIIQFDGLENICSKTTINLLNVF